MKKKFVANLTWKQLDSSLFLNKVADWSPAILLKRDSDTGVHRGGSMAAKMSKMERFVITVNGWKSFTIIAKRSILDVAAALDPPLNRFIPAVFSYEFCKIFRSTYFAKHLRAAVS